MLLSGHMYNLNFASIAVRVLNITSFLAMEDYLRSLELPEHKEETNYDIPAVGYQSSGEGCQAMQD
jgi:hypothetical protein